MVLKSLSEYIIANAPMTNLPELLSLHHGNPLGLHPIVIPLFLLVMAAAIHITTQRINKYDKRSLYPLLHILLGVAVLLTYYYCFSNDLPLFEDRDLHRKEISVGWFCQKDIVGLGWSLLGELLLTYIVFCFLTALVQVVAHLSDTMGMAEQQWIEWQSVIFVMLLGVSIAGANGIKADAETLLIYSPPHFTWMDTNYPAATPREGYPIEIQSFWYHALVFLGGYKKDYLAMAETVAESFEKYFYRSDLERYSDCIHVKGGFAPVSAGIADDHIRPNQLFALTLGLVKDERKMFSIISNCEKLIIPGAIRSLADVPVKYELPVYRDGRLLNDPAHPYWGSYNGPEDTRRKAAYHNGTAWGWVFPSYCEALYIAGGEVCRSKALLLLLSSVMLMENGAAGQLPEVVEGNYPHKSGGCPAQAWSMSEFGRVYHLLEKKKEV